MGAICAVCEKPIGLLDKRKLKDGVVCKFCVEKAGCKREGRPLSSIEVWEVCSLCAMSEQERENYYAKRHDYAMQVSAEFAAQRIASVPECPKCPKCGSTSISANKKGFGVGKAVVGAAVAGSIGLVAGNIGSKKVLITCLNCGHQWRAGKS